MRTIVFLAAFSLGLPALAETGDAKIRRLCVSTTQQDCWIKGGTPLCDRAGKACKDLPDATPAKVLSKVGRKWQVETEHGRGYVSDRLMLIDGSK
ncbi:hypothetical protein [Bosea sp. LjRoot237]|uniref:hypothetical protein n=1 Tax=Bosea sp. LjRoot237 TaxID=3342292 RepID=UPI003ECDE890